MEQFLFQKDKYMLCTDNKILISASAIISDYKKICINKGVPVIWVIICKKIA